MEGCVTDGGKDSHRDEVKCDWLVWQACAKMQSSMAGGAQEEQRKE